MEIQSENEPLRKYLNRITMQLMFGIPRAERVTIRKEITQHLRAMIEDEIAEGMPHEEATAAALRRFGNPRKVGKEIRREWLQKHPYQDQVPESSLLSNGTQALAMLALFGLLLPLCSVLFVPIMGFCLPHGIFTSFLYGAGCMFPVLVFCWCIKWGRPGIAQILNTIGLSAIVRYRESNAEPVAKRKYIAMLLEPRASSSQKHDKSPIRAAFSWLISHGVLLLVGHGVLLLVGVDLIFNAIHIFFPHLGEFEKAFGSDGFSMPAMLAGMFFANWAIDRLKVRWAERKSAVTPSKL